MSSSLLTNKWIDSSAVSFDKLKLSPTSGLDSDSTSGIKIKVSRGLTLGGSGLYVGDINGNLDITGNLYVGGSERIDGNLITVGDSFLCTDLMINNNLDVSGVGTFGSDVVITGDVALENGIIFVNDKDQTIKMDAIDGTSFDLFIKGGDSTSGPGGDVVLSGGDGSSSEGIIRATTSALFETGIAVVGSSGFGNSNPTCKIDVLDSDIPLSGTAMFACSSYPTDKIGIRPRSNGDNDIDLEFVRKLSTDSTIVTGFKFKGINGSIQLPLDNQRLQIGVGQDLEFYHDGTNNRINSNTGNLIITGDASFIDDVKAQTLAANSLSPGYVVFSSTGGLLIGNSNFSYDTTKLSIKNSNTQLSLIADSTNFHTDFKTDTTGNLIISPVGGGYDGGWVPAAQSVGIDKIPVNKLSVNGGIDADNIMLGTTSVLNTGEKISMAGTTYPSMVGIQYSDNGAAAGPEIDLYRISTSPANNDLLGKITFNGRDLGNGKSPYASIYAQIANRTAGEEDGALYLNVVKDGTMNEVLEILKDGPKVLTGKTLTIADGVSSELMYYGTGGVVTSGGPSYDSTSLNSDKIFATNGVKSTNEYCGRFLNMHSGQKTLSAADKTAGYVDFYIGFLQGKQVRGIQSAMYDISTNTVWSYYYPEGVDTLGSRARFLPSTGKVQVTFNSGYVTGDVCSFVMVMGEDVEYS